MITRCELEAIITRATVPLEKALAYESLTEGFGEDLQLRYSYCGVATAALQRYLQDHKITTERVITEPEVAPRHMNQRHMSHVALRHESLLIDPTYSQFLSYVGVMPARVLQREALRRFYPARKIAVFPVESSNEFAAAFAKVAHAADVEIEPLNIGHDSYPPDDALRGTSLDEKFEVYRAIWSPNDYKCFPVDEQPALHDHINKIYGLMSAFANENNGYDVNSLVE